MKRQILKPQLFPRNSSGRKNNGFSLVELLIACVIAAILTGIAIPIYINGKVQGGATVSVSDGFVLANLINSMTLGINDFGTTNGTISVVNLSNPATISVVLGAGATSPIDSQERLNPGTTASGVTYANTNTWCLDVVNNTQHAIYNDKGYQKSLNACP